MAKEWDGYPDFFANVGEHALHPTSYGERIWPVSIETLYQMFKQRMEAERAEQEQT